MRGLILTTGLALVLCACATTETTPDYDPPPYPVTDAEMAELLELWREYEMPEPPRDAPLVDVTHTGTSWANGVRQRPYHSFAFLVEPAKGDKRAKLFDGTAIAEGDFRRIEPADGDTSAVNLRECFWHSKLVFKYSRTFAMGIHCWARGHHKLGRDLVAQSTGDRFDSTRETVRQPEGGPPRNTLGTVIWGYWFNLITEPAGDRRAVYTWLAKALADFASLQPTRGYRGDDYQRLLAALGASLQPSTARAGTTKFLIDSLTDVCTEVSEWGIAWVAWNEYFSPPPGSMVGLLVGGFDVVPELVAHLDDPRLTRSSYCHSFNGSPQVCTVGDLARVILTAIADRALPRYGENPETGAWGPTNQPVLDWWAEVKNSDEQAYFKKLAFGEQSEKFSLWQGGGSADACMLVLGQKYPDALIGPYVAALANEKPDITSLLIAITQGSLDPKAKVDLLMQAVTCPHSNHQVDALRELAGIAREKFDAVVLERLNTLDGRLDREAPYYSDAIQFTLLAQLSDDEQVWDALENLARRAEPNLRVRMLGRFGSGDDEVRDRKRWLSFLAGFLDDEDIRRREDDVTQCDPCLRWGTIRIGDFAASRIGEIVGVQPTPEPDWDESRWVSHHKRVAKALAAEGIEP